MAAAYGPPPSCLVPGDCLDGIGVDRGISYIRERLAELNLHANATTTPKVRAYIQRSKKPVAELANERGVSETTIYRWRGRTTATDRSHTPKRLTTKLLPLEEALICELRTRLQLPLDDITGVMWRRCAIGVPSSQRFGLITQNGAVKEPPKKTDPLSRTARSISDSTSDTPARTGRAGVSANEGGVPVIVDMALDEDNQRPV
jgi:hypothetical protein